MRRIVLAVAFAAFGYCQGAFAQTPASPSPPASLDMVAIRAEYVAALASLEAEQKPRIDAALATYETGLRSLEQKRLLAKKLEESLALRSEAERMKDGKPLGALPKTASPEWRLLRVAYENQIQSSKQPAALKVRSIRQRYLQQLAALERSVAAQPDSPVLAAVRFEKMCFAISQQVEQKAYTLTPGAPNREEIPPQGALLVGFNIGPGGFSGRTIIKSIQPVFLTGEGEKPGEVYGQGSRGQHVVAPPGYAVGGMLVKTGDRLDAISITFMKIIPGTLALDPKDLKQSDWFGNTRGPQPRQIGGNGRPVIGVAIKSGADVDSLGLVQLR